MHLEIDGKILFGVGDFKDVFRQISRNTRVENVSQVRSANRGSSTYGIRRLLTPILPFLKETEHSHLSREINGQRLVYPEVHIVCENDAYLVRDNNAEEILGKIPILQNEEGLDKENQIIKLKQYIQKYLELR